MTSTTSSGRTDVPGTVLVTGAAGFIGSHLCDRLLEQGYRVWGLDNLDPEYSPDQKRRNLRDALAHPRMHMVEGDLRDSILVNGLMRDQSFDAVVHLAAHRGSFPSRDDPRTCFDVNLMGTLELLEAMHRNHVPRLVFTSDLAGTGRQRSEEAGTPDEGDRAGSGDSSRGMLPAAKRSAELLSHVYHRSYRLSAHVLRLGPVYGPREAPDLPVHRLALALGERGDSDTVEDGIDAAPALAPDTPLTLLFVDDAVRGIVASLEHLLAVDGDEPPVYELLDLYSDRLVSVEELKDRLASALGDSGRADRGAPESSDGGQPTAPGADVERAGPAAEPADDRSRAWNALGVRPRVPLEEGLGRFLEWLQSSGSEEMQAPGGSAYWHAADQTNAGLGAGVNRPDGPESPGSL